jgi:hypothetical protein
MAVQRYLTRFVLMAKKKTRSLNSSKEPVPQKHGAPFNEQEKISPPSGVRDPMPKTNQRGVADYGQAQYPPKVIRSARGTPRAKATDHDNYPTGGITRGRRNEGQTAQPGGDRGGRGRASREANEE